MVILAETVPGRTDAQRLAALEKGNEVRVYRKELKQSWGAGQPRRSAADVLAAPVWQEESWKVFGVLLGMPKVGRVKANKVLQRCRISPAKTVGGLSERQRGELLGVLVPGGGGTVRP